MRRLSHLMSIALTLALASHAESQEYGPSMEYQDFEVYESLEGYERLHEYQELQDYGISVPIGRRGEAVTLQDLVRGERPWLADDLTSTSRTLTVDDFRDRADRLPLVFDWEEPRIESPFLPPPIDQMPAPPGDVTNDVTRSAGLEPDPGLCGTVGVKASIRSLYCEPHLAYLQRCNEPAAKAAWLTVDPRADTIGDEERAGIIDRYDANCLGRVDLSSETLSPAERLVRSVLVAIFMSDNPDFLCTGVRIGPRRILTAKHCIFDSASKQLIDIRRLAIFPANQPTSVFSVASVDFAGGETLDLVRDLDDVAILDMQKDLPPTDDGTLGVGQGELHAPMLAVGINGLMVIRERILRRLHPDQAQADNSGGFDNWLRFVRVDSAASCLVVRAMPPGCIIHGCQTYPGMSGGALLSREEPGRPPVLLGIITRSLLAQQKTDCSNDAVDIAPNVGLAVAFGSADMLMKKVQN